MAECKIKECPSWESGREECDDCVEGRDIGVVCEYASTCDGCGELFSHEELEMDPETYLGYCEECR
ncbi:MAG: hypothetical protein WA064_00120 [Candidatus Moraniibacteriota bacterium]